MVNNDRHPPSPRLPVVTLPQACPPTLGAFYCGMQVATAGLLGLCPPARRARSEMLRVGNKVSSFYGMQGGLAMLAAMRRRTSSQIPPVLSSFPSLFRLQRWTELNHSSAGGAARLGGSCHVWGDARPDRSLACGDCDARFARARYGYQSRAVRALRLVAHSANELPVRLTG